MNRKPKLKVIEVKLGREGAMGMADFENYNILVDPRQNLTSISTPWYTN